MRKKNNHCDRVIKVGRVRAFIRRNHDGGPRYSVTFKRFYKFDASHDYMSADTFALCDLHALAKAARRARWWILFRFPF